VTLVWSWEAALGLYPPFQDIKPGSYVLRGEANLDDNMMALALERKLERVSSFRQVQAVSHQVHQLSKGRENVDSFKLPPGCNVRPVRQNEVRCTASDATGNHAHIRDNETGQQHPVLSPGLVDVKLLLLQLDHGSIGAAGVAKLELHDGRMITARFDKIHRVIRCLKNAAGKVPIFVKTKLWSAYLYSFNKRPFGSGWNATVKQRLLQVFMQHHDINSEVFIKYLPRLSKVWLGY